MGREPLDEPMTELTNNLHAPWVHVRTHVSLNPNFASARKKYGSLNVSAIFSSCTWMRFD